MRPRSGQAFLLLVFLIAAFSSSTARAQEPLKWPLHVAIGVGLVLQGIDAAQTMYLSGASRAQETNPVFAPFLDKPTAAGAFKFSIATTSAGVQLGLHQKAPRKSLAAALLADGFYTWVVIHNAQALRATGQR